MNNSFEESKDKQGNQSSEEGKEKANDSDNNDSKDQKKNRRKRNDSKEREYLCGCGKNYLSYPALYTHIKQKHNGITPTGTMYPSANGKGRKGRPKNTDQGGSIEYENDLNDSYISEEDYDPLDELLYFLKTLGKYLKQDYDSNFFVNAMQKFPYGIFRHEQQHYQRIIDNLKQFEKMNKEQFQQFLEQEQQQEGIKTTKLNLIFAIFLYEISICITPECFQEIAYLVCVYRYALNKLGWEKLRENGRNVSQLQLQSEFCEEQNGELVLEFANEFTTNIFPQFANDYPIENFLIIGTDAEKKQNTNYLTKHFCNWFFHKKYTTDKLSINPNES